MTDLFGASGVRAPLALRKKAPKPPPRPRHAATAADMPATELTRAELEQRLVQAGVEPESARVFMDDVMAGKYGDPDGE